MDHMGDMKKLKMMPLEITTSRMFSEVKLSTHVFIVDLFLSFVCLLS